MNSRWLSTFTLLGALLLILGAVGLTLQHSGAGFVFDPGQPPPADGKDNTPWYYLVIGALMVLNGLLTPPSPAAEKTGVREPGVSGPAIKPRARGGREAVATTAEKTGE